jgi:hypothetical protein
MKIAILDDYQNVALRRGVKAVSSPVVRRRNVLKKNSPRIAAALIAVLISCVVGPNAVLAAAAQHHDQVPGFYRLNVGDVEATALFDGFGVFDLQWLKGQKATMDGVNEGDRGGCYSTFASFCANLVFEAIASAILCTDSRLAEKVGIRSVDQHNFVSHCLSAYSTRKYSHNCAVWSHKRVFTFPNERRF